VRIAVASLTGLVDDQDLPVPPRTLGSMRTSAQAEDEFQRNLISIVN
jgi:hypothetical protein